MELLAEPLNLISRFSFNFIIVFIIIKIIYYRNNSKNDDFVFTYFMFNALIFFFAYILGNITINLGFAFGLFAVFAILRYRTDTIPIKEMTYLFIVITIGVINALSGSTVSFVILLIANLIITLMAYVLENFWQSHYLITRTIIYENVENIKPENHEELLSELKNNTGFNIEKFEIESINFRRGAARIKIFTRE
ncbi:uncharacterized protein METZ01_LOCUS129479 [marine metagenome]|uniref:DUF4956 domain-containing protein n=1 Tax=marine metagenome TaxID=408172 RepID=A0A381YI22_9ZZZZ|tara:strand:- start:3104 stop:3685 length:582 start_codon:yes stop_codon:yes gene_type:complete